MYIGNNGGGNGFKMLSIDGTKNILICCAIVSSLIIFRLLRDFLCFLSLLFSYISQVQPREKKYQEYFSLESLSNLYKITDSHILKVNNSEQMNPNAINRGIVRFSAVSFISYYSLVPQLLHVSQYCRYIITLTNILDGDY